MNRFEENSIYPHLRQVWSRYHSACWTPKVAEKAALHLHMYVLKIGVKKIVLGPRKELSPESKNQYQLKADSN